MLAIILGTTFLVKGQQNSTQTESSNPNVRLGQKALMDGDFKAAASHLQKAMPSESGNPNVLYMLGYSQYHSQAYSKAVSSFSKVIGLKPDYGTAYYYRGKTRNTLSQSSDKMSDGEREKLLKGSIDDFSKAIELDSTNLNFYQNRAISYRDLGNLLGTKGLSNYNKEDAAGAYNASIKDLEYVLAQSPGRKDVAAELKKAKIYRDNIK
ncbi:hypothetical protein SAMN05216436_102226 [bacterium A37T11]|nr:hypothetical protein SAMN05216436_102226 [bacterium A37T11]